jgi:hypothetical protein
MPPWQRGVRGVNGQVKVKIPGQLPVMGLPWNRKSQSTKRKKQKQNLAFLPRNTPNTRKANEEGKPKIPAHAVPQRE